LSSGILLPSFTKESALRTPFLGIAVVLVTAGGAAHAAAQAPSPPLTYRAALELATQRNLSLEAARRQRAIREAQVRAAGQVDNPTLLFEASRDVPHEVLSLEVPVGLGIKRARRIDLAKEELTLADVDVQTELRTLRRNLRGAYYGLLAADDAVRIAGEIVAVAERGQQVAQARFDEGAAPKLDVLQADLGVARARADLEVTRSARARAQSDLNAVLNQPPATSIVLADRLTDLAAIPGFEAAMALASTSNPDLVAAERELAVEQRHVDLLRAERWPTPTFTFGGVFDAPGEFKAGAMGGVSIGLPLFSRNQGEIAQSLATSAQIRARHDAVHRMVESGVFGAVATVDAQRKQADTYRQTLVPTATAILGLAEESYRLGRSSVLSVLDAQRSYRDVSREYLQSLLDLQMAIADLEEIIGASLQ
jgi:cobalt-zinc-cadmium efflux system outer membrane protein